MLRLPSLFLPLLAGCDAAPTRDTDEPPTRPPPEFLEPRDTVEVPSSSATTEFWHDDGGSIEGAAFAGDLDGDGLPNIVAWGSRAGGQTSEVYLFGTALPSVAYPSNGVLLEGPTSATTSDPDPYIERPSADHDLSGDGIVDLVVPIANLYGGIRVVYGPLPSTDALLPADATILSDSGTDLPFLTRTGDLDGDGIADVSVVGASYAARDRIVYVLHGPISGTLDIADADATVSYEDGLGGLASPEDIDGDGYADLLVGHARYGGTDTTNVKGAAWLMRGPVTGEREVADANAMMIGEGGGDSVGHQMEFVGDVDGDGKGDILLGSEYFEGGWNYSAEGVAWLVLGVPSGTLDLEEADAHLLGDVECGLAGQAVAGAGDIDGDGFADVAVGVPSFAYYGCAQSLSQVALVRGPVEGNLWLSGPDVLITHDYPLLGTSLDGGADYDGDGRDDLLAGTGYQVSLFTRLWP